MVVHVLRRRCENVPIGGSTIHQCRAARWLAMAHPTVGWERIRISITLAFERAICFAIHVKLIKYAGQHNFIKVIY